MWRAVKGATVLIPSGPAYDPDRMHLHVVLRDPSLTGEVLLACICTIPLSNLYDSSCTLFPGEHPFIKDHSYVDYANCRIARASLVEEKVRTREFAARSELDPRRLEDVLVGFNDSTRVAPKYRRFFASP